MSLIAGLENVVRAWMSESGERSGDACVIRSGKRAFCKVCSLLADCQVLVHEGGGAAARPSDAVAEGPVTRVLRRIRPAPVVPSFTPFLPAPALGRQNAPRTAAPPPPGPDPAGPA